MTTDSELALLNLALPKWPLAKITGESVTNEQALEIIRRVDSFFGGSCGNDATTAKKLWQSIGYPDDSRAVGTQSLGNLQKVASDTAAWKESWEFLDLHFLSTSWVSTAFVYGPSGWIAPDGKIMYQDNIGKWPSAHEVYADLAVLTQNFKFLNMELTLYSGENCQVSECPDGWPPIMTFVVREGVLRVVDAERGLEAHLGRTWHPRNSSDLYDDFRVSGLTSVGYREHGMRDHFDAYVAKAKNLRLA